MHKINASSFTTHRTRDLLLSFNNFAVKLKTKQTIFASFQIANMSLKLGDQFPNFALKQPKVNFNFTIGLATGSLIELLLRLFTFFSF